jgi:hypothetical protein
MTHAVDLFQTADNVVVEQFFQNKLRLHGDRLRVKSPAISALVFLG